MKTRGRILNMMYPETHATDKTVATIQVQCAKRHGDRRPLLRHPVTGRKAQQSRSQRNLRPTRARRKAGRKTWFGSQEQRPGISPARRNGGQKKPTRRRGARTRRKIVHEAGLTIKERKAPWRRSLKKKQQKRKTSWCNRQRNYYPWQERTKERKHNY